MLFWQRRLRSSRLLNALYREIKLELADAIMTGFPRKKSIRDRLRHVWDRYVEWGVANPMQQRVLTQIEVGGGLTEESKAAGAAPFAEIQAMTDAAVEQRIMRELPQQFVGAMIRALAETTMEFMRRNSGQAELYRNAGFEVLWAGITRKR